MEENICIQEEVRGEGRKFNDGELHYLYSSPTVIRVMKWAG
jgi:hypothetical protein